MGHHKKRTTTTNTCKKPLSPPQTPSHSSDSPAIDLLDSSAIKQECEKAFNALRRGNHTKALRLMKESSHKNDNSPLFHRVHATVAAKFAGVIDDPNSKQRHFKTAVDSARKAALLSPNSIEFAHFYANLLFDTANDGKDYEEVVSECERALAIENPIDPIKDNLNHPQQQEERSPALSSAEARIAQVQNELRGLIQKSNIASISAWMKNLGGPPGEEKFRLIPLRRLSEDPLDSRYFSTSNSNARRPNEIKKATKTPEERRKEIEVRVAAARLLQQKSEQGGNAKDSKNGGGSQSCSLVSGSKVGERRRHGSYRRNSSFSERKDQVSSFWNSMTCEMKRGLLSVRVSDLSAHISGLSNKDGGQACEILSEALHFGKMNKTWRFWACCRCGEKFSQADANIQHVIQEHMGNLFPKVQATVPQSVDHEWADMLVSCSWKPLDLTASVRMLQNQSKAEDSALFSKENHEECIDGCWSDSLCSEVWVSFPAKKSLADGCNGGFWENEGDDRDLNIECITCDREEGSKVYSLANSWPLSDDIERAKLLEKISFLFQMLVRHKCLAATLLQKLIHFTMEELQSIFPGSQILSSGVNETPLCICFLGATQLKKILKLLQDVSHACGVSRYPEKVTPDDVGNCSQGTDCEETIMFNEDESCLLLDESLFGSDGMRNDVSSGNSIGISEKGVQSGSDSFLSWIYGGLSSGEQLAAWCRLREEKSQQVLELLQLLEKEISYLQSLCDGKFEYVRYEKALQRLEELCREESKKREHSADFSHCSFDSILKKRRDEIREGENEGMCVSDRLELDAISNVLKEAETLNVNQFGYEDTYVGVTSHLYDLEAGEDDWRSKDYNQDTCIEIAINKIKEHLSIELCKIDARMLRNVVSMQQLELKLEPVSALDYRSIILPLVKSFMRAHLEDLAEKDATEKSDAAREAFLAELALDSKKGTGNGNDSSKHMHDKMKDKKKNKDSRRNKDLKVGSCNELLEPSENCSLGVSSDGDHVDNDSVASESCEKLKKLEEEFRRKIELEAEERKLEETLEYQRHLENEAKQKLLAEQCRRNVSAISQDDEKCLGDVSLEPGFSAAVQCTQEQLVLKNVPEENKDGVGRNLRDGSDCAGIANDECDRNASSYLKQGSSDGEIPNGVLRAEQRAGRKGKRRSSTKLPEGRYQTVSDGKENVKLENTAVDILQKEQVWNQGDGFSPSVADSGLKTLRQLQAEEDEEERFQADLKKAVRQSLDTFQARQKVPLVPSFRVVGPGSQTAESLGIEAGERTSVNVNEMDSFGVGLQNEMGEYNCFLNVIIQSLWHLRRFREAFLRRSPSEHVHVGDPCVVCALFDILTTLSVASGDSKSEPVAPTTLRIALSNLYPESNFFQEGQMNDASEVLAVIFECLHQSFTSSSGGSDTESVESNCLGSWDCSIPCIAHTLFGMDIFERMNCYNCGLESRHLKYTSFFHNINASALRTMKVMCAENSFDELLNFVEMNHQLACDLEGGGCGKFNHIHHILSNPPHIFTTVLGWQNTCESVDDIKVTLTALDTKIDISVLYRGLDPKNMHRLVSVVCYYGQHYHCFAYSHDRERWIMYDDKTVKVIGTWEEVLSMCERGHLQPQVLFYEAAN